MREAAGLTSAPPENTGLPRLALALEGAALFLAVPLILYFHGTRWNVHMALWGAALYAGFIMRRMPGFSWRRLWNGNGWLPAHRKAAIIRFVLLSAAVMLLARIIAPERLLSFPMQRPWFWLLVMVLYPVLSVMPQEFLLRGFFFRRYAPLFGNSWTMIIASAFAFGFVHVVFHNAVAPLLSFIGGIIIGRSYTQHRSLKWAAVEHAAYGCMVFTVGLGFYFLVGHGRL